MKKILRVYDRLAAWLCKWGSDKYVHLLAGLLISYLWLCVLLTVRGDGMRMIYAWYGVVAAGGVALIKELIDDMRGGRIDPQDIVFTMAGGLIGSLLFLIG